MCTQSQPRNIWYAPRSFTHPSMWVQRAWESHRTCTTSFQAQAISQLPSDMSNANVGLCVGNWNEHYLTNSCQKHFIKVLQCGKNGMAEKRYYNIEMLSEKIKGMLCHGKWPKVMVTQHKKGRAKIMIVEKWSTGGFWLTNGHDAHRYSLLNLLLIFTISEMIQTLFWEARR